MSETISNNMSTPRQEKQNINLEKRSPQIVLRGTDIESNVALPSIETKNNQKGKCTIFHICFIFKQNQLLTLETCIVNIHYWDVFEVKMVLRKSYLWPYSMLDSLHWTYTATCL